MIIRSAMDHANVPQDEYAEALGVASRDFIYLAASKRYGRGASATNTDRLESLKASSALLSPSLACKLAAPGGCGVCLGGGCAQSVPKRFGYWISASYSCVAPASC